MAEKKPEQEKSKNILTKIKESVDDKEEQLAFLSTIVRLAVLVWSAGILTLAYVKLPAAFNIPEQKLDPTFIASVFTGTLATFGVQAAGKKKSSAEGGSANISKKDMEFLIAKASETAPAQTIRIESGPVKIVPDVK
jgi:hypothetical protein